MDDKERERRRKRYKFALVKWSWPISERSPYFVEHKRILGMKAYAGLFDVVCDWEPERVLKGMKKLLKE